MPQVLSVLGKLTEKQLVALHLAVGFRLVSLHDTGAVDLLCGVMATSSLKFFVSTSRGFIQQSSMHGKVELVQLHILMQDGITPSCMYSTQA